ncbi:MAG: M23 family metallopeptidase, partial [Patescibacteria group bacterium]
MKKISIFLVFLTVIPAQALAAPIIDITFPVDGENRFIDDFDQSRGDHVHHATDIMADKMIPVLAAQSGTVTYAPIPEPSWGWMIRISGDDGYTYNYIHLNNDTPGTDDGNGGVENAYAPDVRQGARVNRGQLIGWVGDSGNAESIGSHLHFEIYNGGTAINPYESLLAAQGVEEEPNHEPEPEVLGETSMDLDYDISTEQAQAWSINEDMDLALASGKTYCESNSLIRTHEL